MSPTDRTPEIDTVYNQIQELLHQRADYQDRLKLGTILYQYLTFNSAAANPQHR